MFNHIKLRQQTTVRGGFSTNQFALFPRFCSSEASLEVFHCFTCCLTLFTPPPSRMHFSSERFQLNFLPWKPPGTLWKTWIHLCQLALNNTSLYPSKGTNMIEPTPHGLSFLKRPPTNGGSTCVFSFENQPTIVGGPQTNKNEPPTWHPRRLRQLEQRSLWQHLAKGVLRKTKTNGARRSDLGGGFPMLDWFPPRSKTKQQLDVCPPLCTGSLLHLLAISARSDEEMKQKKYRNGL